MSSETHTKRAGADDILETQAAAPRRLSRGTWVAIACAVACLAVMGAVIVLAGQENSSGESAAAGAHTGGDAPLTNRELFGRQTGAGTPAAFSACGPLDPDNPPEVTIDVEDGVLDLGKLKQGVTIDRDVTFRNTGTGPLCIGKVSTGCGCLKASLVGEERRYEPGESGKIRLVANTTGRVGIISKQVSILCNDMKSPRRSFRVKMDVSTGLISEPRYLQFGNVPPGVSATRTLILRSGRDEKAWTVLGIESTRRIAGRDPVAYTFEVEPLPDPRYRRIKLRVTHPGYKELGAIRDLVVLKTNHPERPRIEVPAHIQVVPRIRSKSRSISLGFVQGGAPRGATRARIEAGAPGVKFKILKVAVVPPEGARAGPGGVGFTATHGSDARGAWVDVKYDGKTRGPGLLEARLEVHTDDEQQPLLTIPIRATVRAPR